jgi:hypothetical protein
VDPTRILRRAARELIDDEPIEAAARVRARCATALREVTPIFKGPGFQGT